MSIYHIVHFGYSGTATPEQKHKVSTAFMDLAKACLLPSGMSGKEGDTYIQSIVGGSNNSPEGMSYGLEHSFVLTFRNLEERDYYLDQDPAHQEFKAMIQGIVTSATVLDFDNGRF